MNYQTEEAISNREIIWRDMLQQAERELRAEKEKVKALEDEIAIINAELLGENR